MNYYYSPLESFEIIVYRYPIFINFLDITVSNFVFFLFISLVTIWFFLSGSTQYTVVPTVYQLCIERFYLFMLELVRLCSRTTDLVLPLFPGFFSLFLFLTTANLVGLLPFSYTITAQFGLTLLLGMIFNVGFFFLGLYHNGWRFFYLFVPSGAPKFLIPLVVVIEVVSYGIRMFSLAIRLFANMIAGHTLIHILSSFVTILLKSSKPFYAIFPFLLVMSIFVLEVGIAIIQAYVFTVLLCIYISDAYSPSH